MRMMQQANFTISNSLKRFRKLRYFLILEGMIVGVLAGFTIVLFRILLDLASELLNFILAYGKANTWFIPVWFLILTAVSLVVSALLIWEPYISGSGIPQMEGEMQGEIKQTWWRVLSAKFAGALLCIGCGLSLGREGPSIQLGSMVGKGFSRLTKRMRMEERLLMTCGASAGLSAAFNAPIAGVLFSLEEVHKNFSPEVLLSTMASSITANFITRNIFGLEPIFSFHVPNMLPLNSYGHVIVVGMLLGLLGVFYNTCLIRSQKMYQKIPKVYFRVLIPFLAAGVMGFVYPAVLGGGHTLVDTISEGQMAVSALILLFVVKFIFSMVSFGSGAPGGIFLPLLVLGAIIGGSYNELMGNLFPVLNGYIGNFVILGMTGYFSAIVRAPITGIILITEMTGTFNHLLTLSMAALMAYLIPDIMKCAPVYDQLLHRLLENRKWKKPHKASGEKVLVEGMIYHGSAAEGKNVSAVTWPKASLIVSITRGEDEFIPKGDTRLRAGDHILLICDENDAPDVYKTIEEYCQKMKEP